MLAIVFIAVACAALGSPSDLSATCQLALTLFALTLGTIAARVCAEPRKSYWWAFAFTGWGYLTLSLAPLFSSEVRPWLITTQLIDRLCAALSLEENVATPMMAPLLRNPRRAPPQWCLERTLHAQFALAFACAGAAAARLIAARDRAIEARRRLSGLDGEGGEENSHP